MSGTCACLSFQFGNRISIVILSIIAINITEYNLIWDFVPAASNMDACLVFGPFVPLFLNLAGPFII